MARHLLAEFSGNAAFTDVPLNLLREPARLTHADLTVKKQRKNDINKRKKGSLDKSPLVLCLFGPNCSVTTPCPAILYVPRPGGRFWGVAVCDGRSTDARRNKRPYTCSGSTSRVTSAGIAAKSNEGSVVSTMICEITFPRGRMRSSVGKTSVTSWRDF